MRILLATYFVMPDTGGVQVYVEALKQGLERLGHQVDLLAHHPDYDRYYMVGTDRTFYKSNVMPYVDRKIRPYFNETFPELDRNCVEMELGRYCYELGAAYMGLGHYDVIHTQDVFSTMAMYRVKSDRTALIASIHGEIVKEMMHSGTVTKDEGVGWNYVSSLVYYAAVCSDTTVVASQWLKDMMASDFGVPYEHMSILPNGINMDAFAARAEGLTDIRAIGGRKVLICPARLDPVKGHRVLIDALNIVKSQRTDWECWIVGDGATRAALEEQVNSLGLSGHVQFLGNRSDVPQLMKQSDLLVMASLQDNFPYAAIEAQISGKPCVVSDAGGIPEIVQHGETGLVSPVGNASAMANNINRLLEDDAVRKAMGESARRHGLAYWSSDRMVAETVALYERVLAIKRGVAT
jgi:glycosyltransferase involved in cell wall biosynthesis